MAFDRDLASLIVAQGFASEIGVDLFLSRNAKLPTGDGPYVSLVELSGHGVKNTHSSTYPNVTAQLTIRALKNTTARTLAFQVFAYFNSVDNATVNGTFYQWIRSVQAPYELPADDASRARWAFNVEAMFNQT